MQLSSPLSVFLSAKSCLVSKIHQNWRNKSKGSKPNHPRDPPPISHRHRLLRKTLACLIQPPLMRQRPHPSTHPRPSHSMTTSLPPRHAVLLPLDQLHRPPKGIASCRL